MSESLLKANFTPKEEVAPDETAVDPKAEYLKKVNDCIDAGKEVPDGMGGFGFNLNAKPHPDCPECGGLGNEGSLGPVIAGASGSPPPSGAGSSPGSMGIAG